MYYTITLHIVLLLSPSVALDSFLFTEVIIRITHIVPFLEIVLIDFIVSFNCHRSFILWIKYSLDLISTDKVGAKVVNKNNCTDDLLPFCAV